MTGIISVYITVPSRTETETIATALVEDRLAACVTIIPGVQSTYHWQGKIETAEEFILIAKTRAELFELLAERVKALHSHSCPCIVATPLIAGHPPYLDWVKNETRK